MKTYRIVQYIQPWEIDDLERQIHQHIASSYYIKNHEIIFDVTMNISDELINWNESKIQKKYFIDKFEYLKLKLNNYYFSEFDTNENIQGVTDKRRNCASKNQNFIIWLDSDLFFSYLTLPNLINASLLIEDLYFILSPQIIKYWDDSWDCIVNDEFLLEPYNQRDYFDSFCFDKKFNDREVCVKKNKNIKFGGGWFNLISDNVLKKIPIPDKIGSYGPDDTYLSIIGKKCEISQYILENCVVSEIGKKLLTNKNYIKPHLCINRVEKNKISDLELYQLINNFV